MSVVQGKGRLEGNQNPFPRFIPWIQIHSAGQPSTFYNVRTFIRFLASNVREETWPASIVKNERDFLGWNGWPNHEAARASKQWSTVCFFVMMSTVKRNLHSEKKPSLWKEIRTFSIPFVLDIDPLNFFAGNAFVRHAL